MHIQHILVNPQAGGGRAARLVAPLREWAAARPSPCEVAAPGSVAEALAYLNRLPRGQNVALVGGDGTINQMLPPLLERDVCLLVVPRGSGNDVARALGVAGLDWRAALEGATHARMQALDVGWLHTQEQKRPFLSSMTAGFDSAVGFRALHGPRWLRGLPRYLLATLRELAALQTWEMQVQLDGETVHQGSALFASVLNTPTYGSGMPAVPHASTHDGALDALVAGHFNVPQTLLMLPRLLMGRHLSHPRVLTRPFTSLHLSAGTPVPLATDGEYVGESATLSVQIAAGALRVLSR